MTEPKPFYVRVYFEDTDCGGIVYHTNYIKYCERARSELFYQSGMLPVEGSSGFVLTHINASFQKSARLGDLLEVRTTLKELKNASVIITQEIFRIQSLELTPQSPHVQNLNAPQEPTPQESILHATQETKEAMGERLFSAEITLAFVDVAKGRAVKIPAHIAQILKS